MPHWPRRPTSTPAPFMLTPGVGEAGRAADRQSAKWVMQAQAADFRFGTEHCGQHLEHHLLALLI